MESAARGYEEGRAVDTLNYVSHEGFGCFAFLN